MRRHDFPIVTFVSILGLALAGAWQVHRAMEFNQGMKAVDVLADRLPVEPLARPVELPEFKLEPTQGCITVFRPPQVKPSPVEMTGWVVKPRPRFTLLGVEDGTVELQLNREGVRVKGLRLGGYFHFQGERYYLIEVRPDEVTLRQMSNRRQFSAFAGMDPRRRHEHHL